MMKNTTLTLTIAALLASSALPVLADDENVEVRKTDREHRRMMWFEHIDGHDSGHPPMPPRPPMPPNNKEYQEMRTTMLEQQFKEFDLNNDGYVSLTEMTEVMERQARERAEQAFAKLDQDGTGMVNFDAFNSSMMQLRTERREIVRERIEVSKDRAEQSRERHHERRKRDEKPNKN